jgi:hypothetical protein
LTDRFKVFEPSAAATLPGVMPARNKDRVLDRHQVGLTRERMPGGAERLLAELMMRGLDREHLRDGALLVAALDDELNRERSARAAA